MGAKVRSVLSVIVGGVMFMAMPVGAADVNIKITGEIYIPHCKINNDAHTSFRKIPLQKVVAENMLKPGWNQL
ncbi:UNVERIFIED_ORG: hypothetical protein FHU00_5006 [Citrobacter freundii]